MIEKENGQKRPLIFLEESRYKPDRIVIPEAEKQLENIRLLFDGKIYRKGSYFMLKRVNFSDYRMLKSFYKITVITANDTEALILIHK